MTNLADVPATIVLDEAPAAAPARRGLRRITESKLVLPAAAALVILALDAGRGEPPAPPPPLPGASAPVAGGPRFVTALTARPGERIAVLAYRDRRFCGPAELRLDGAPVAHRATGTAVPFDADWAEVLLTMDLPRSVAPGRHEVALYGPMPGGPPGPVCGDLREHQGRMATRIITVA